MKLQHKKEEVMIIDDAALAWEYEEKKLPYVFLLTKENRQEPLPTGCYCIESREEIDEEYLDRVYRRFYDIPWEILTTKRLLVREITVEDVPRLFELYRDESITKYMEKLFPTIQQEEEYTRNYIRNIYHFYGYGMWLLVLKESGEIIGRAGLEYKEGFTGLELGFMLGEAYQHKGYAYEACRAILDYAREELGETDFRAVVHKENIHSKHLCEKLGFHLEAAEDYLEYRMTLA